MLAPMVVLLLGLDGALAGHILSYKEAQHSRTEAGVPGTNVTGKWSWVDNHGQQHHVWYVADTRGFRAFGDVVPEDEQSPPFLKIGTPAIGSIIGAPSSSTGALAKSLPSPSLPERKLLPIGTPVLGGPRITPDMNRNNHFSIFALADFPEISKVEAALQEDIKTTTYAPPVITPIPDFTFGAKTHSLKQEPLVNEETEGSFTSQAADQKHDTLPKRNENERNNFQIKGTSKSMSSTAAENGVMQKTFGKAITTSSTSNEGKPTQLNMGNTKLESKDMEIPLEVLLPAPGPGSAFVLIDRLRHPTMPKPRVGSPPIVPQPVSMQSPSATQIIMGLYTSGRPPAGQRLAQPSTNLVPLGIHLLNFDPFRKNSKSLSSSSSRPVPKPIRVVGAPNLENFYRPATLARTTPSPFRRPNPMRDYDYLYSDYDYYDYANYDTGSSTGGPKNTENSSSQSSKDGSDENDNSTELDSDESDK